jgi:hypothetical protein
MENGLVETRRVSMTDVARVSTRGTAPETGQARERIAVRAHDSATGPERAW